jgi:hypothetical protein
VVSDKTPLPAKLADAAKPVANAAAYGNLYENMLNGGVIKPLALLNRYRQTFTQEPEG